MSTIAFKPLMINTFAIFYDVIKTLYEYVYII